MAQEFYRPPKLDRRNDDEESEYDAPLIPTSSKVATPASDNAQKTLDDIDSVLNDNAQPTASGVSSSESTDKGTDGIALGGKKSGDTEKPGDEAETQGRSLFKDDEGGKKKKKGGLKGLKSRVKKRVYMAIIGAVVSLVAGIILSFGALLPDKLISIVKSLQAHYGATSSTSMSDELDSEVNGFVDKGILPSLASGACHSTVDPSCTVTANGTGLVGQLWQVWGNSRMQNYWANNGLIFAKNGQTYYMNVNGKQYDLKDIRSGKLDIFSLPGTSTATREDIRAAINDVLKNGTLWDKTYRRYKVWGYLKSQFGIAHCITDFGCSLGTKITTSITNKKLAAKAYVIQHVISPLSENYGLIIQCVMSDASFCNTALNPAAPGDSQELSDFQQKLIAQLQTYLEKYGQDSLDSLVSTAQSISKDGFKKVIARQIAAQIADLFGGDSAKALAGEFTDKAIPVFGIAVGIGTLVHEGSKIGPLLSKFSYATNSAAVANLSSMYDTVVSEQESGNTDAGELGSFTDALSTNLSGSSTDQSDATDTPLYHSIIDDGEGTTDSYKDTNYLCDNGQPVPAGKQTCDEEALDGGNAVADNVSNTINAVPGLAATSGALSWAGSLTGDITGPIFNNLCNTAGRAVGCPQLLSFIGNQIAPIITSIGEKLIPSFITDTMSGGRTFDALAAGEDVTANETCQAELGCAQISDTAVASQQSAVSAEAKEQFDSMPMFARIFDTGSQYSLVSRIAMAMPTNFMVALHEGVASIFSDPLGKIGSAFATIFSHSTAFAATTPQPDPFGVPQAGYTNIPTDPEGYWNNNCVNGPMGIYNSSTNTLDISAWLNNDPSTEQGNNPNTAQDPATGRQINLVTNPCLLIQATVQSAGGIFDNSLLPASPSS
ncbi:MAG TPA: hypothetical protein VIM53_04465 [Candidatus Saccharimonadales bacterium]